MSKKDWPKLPYNDPRDPYGCRADYEFEMITEARRLAHLDGECKAPCDWCDDEKERGDESLGG